MPAKLHKTKQAIIADAVGLGHCIVANVMVVIGYFYDFQLDPDKFDGLKFVYRYVDFPVFHVFYKFMGRLQYDDFYTIVLGEIVIIISSVLYGLVAFIIAKAIFPGDD